MRPDDIIAPYVRHRRSMESSYAPSQADRDAAKLAAEFTSQELRAALVIRATYERSLPPVDVKTKGAA